jgi:hypothetical protein
MIQLNMEREAVMKTLPAGQFVAASKRVREMRQSVQPLNGNPLDEVLVIVCATSLVIVLTRFLGII